MEALTAQCAACGAVLRVPLRPGPSGALRVGAMPLRCRGCGRENLVGTRGAAELTA